MATDRGFSIQKLMARPDPLMSFHWMCLDGTLPFGLPCEYLESIDIPFTNVKTDTVFSGSGYLSYPLSHEVEAFNMVLYEDSESSAVKWVNDWKSKIKDFNTGSYGLPSEYKRDITVGMLSNNGAVSVRYTLIGVWPTQTANLSLNYTESGRITISQSFAIDDVLIEHGNYKQTNRG